MNTFEIRKKIQFHNYFQIHGLQNNKAEKTTTKFCLRVNVSTLKMLTLLFTKSKILCIQSISVYERFRQTDIAT